MNEKLTEEQKKILSRPKSVAEAMGGGVKPETVLTWLRGYRNIPICRLNDLIVAHPHVDARWLVATMAERFAARNGGA